MAIATLIHAKRVISAWNEVTTQVNTHCCINHLMMLMTHTQFSLLGHADGSSPLSKSGMGAGAVVGIVIGALLGMMNVNV